MAIKSQSSSWSRDYPRKAEEARRVAEEAEKARREAEEKKEKAEEAKKEQEQKAEESKKKAEELKKAEAEAAAALEKVKNVSSAAAEATEHAKKLAAKKNTNATKAAVNSAPKSNVTTSTEQKNAKKTALVTVKSCDAQQKNARALIQEKLAMFGVQCEDMCKEMGVYPKCQCPGFAGQPADGDDNRACIAKNCQDPSSPCPNDAFMTCVKQTTKVSVLQWDALMQKFDSTMGLYKNSLAAAKKAKEIRCPAPIFVAEGQYCVCKDL